MGVAQLVELRIVIPAVVGSIPIVHPIFFYIGVRSKNAPVFGPLAQLVEQETLNLLVECSSHSWPTNKLLI